MNNYELEYQIIPKLVDDFKYGVDFELLFSHPCLRIMTAAGFELDDGLDFPFDDLKFESTEGENYKQILITFLEPDHEPEALYGLIIKYEGKLPVYFTLEKTSSDKSCYICNPKVDIHLNLGLYRDIHTKEDFIRKVHELIECKPEL